MKRTLVSAVAVSLLLVACGGNNGDSSSTNNDTNNATNNGGTNNGGTNNGGTNNGDTNNTTNNATNNDHLEVHGCTFDTATDMTGEVTVELTDVEAWNIPHNVCLIVSTGTVVTWQGNMAQHPLRGGEMGAPDAANPIQIAGTAPGNNVEVTFDTAGDYPYYCELHPGVMNGVVYVVD